MVNFGSRLMAAIRENGNLGAGIDPHPGLLEKWGLNDDADGLREFGDRALRAVAGMVALIKPQSAFYERHGSKGLAALELLLADARSAGVISLLDVKRGDIGSTMDAYADAYLGDDSVFAPDAITISPYLGFGSIKPAVDAAFNTDRGVFVLCLTSNPEGAEVQMAERGGSNVAKTIADRATAENRKAIKDGHPLGHVGLVVGANVGQSVIDSGIDLAGVQGPILIPGTGAQGGDVGDLGRVFGGVADRAVVSSARALLEVGPDTATLRSHAEATRDHIARSLSG